MECNRARSQAQARPSLRAGASPTRHGGLAVHQWTGSVQATALTANF